MTLPESLQVFFQEIKSLTGIDLRTDTYHRMLYSTDASIYQVMPYGVMFPRNEEDVHAAVELAARYQIPLLPRTAGSSLAGQAVNEAVVIDFTRHLDKVLEINPEAGWVRVQPGVVLDDLNIALHPHGLKYGPDPASSNRAAMGGIVSNNSTGAHSILYGMTADHILECKGYLSDGSPFHFYPVEDDLLAQKQRHNGLEGSIYREVVQLVTENGEVIRRGTPRHWRRCGGYNLDRLLRNGVPPHHPQDPRFNLARLICGSEGTLAVMSEIKLNLVPIPRKSALALVHFNNLHEALTTVPRILEVEPSAVELLDNLGLTLCKSVPEYARLLSTFMKGEPNCILVTEFYGESEGELKAAVERLKAHLQNARIACEIIPAFDDQLQQNVWTVRKVGLGLPMSIKGDYKPIPFIEDAAVPPEHLAEYISRIEKFCNDLGTRVAYYAHASAGCLHVRPLINTKIASDINKLPKIAGFSAELVGQYGGALSSEHGDGRCRSWLNERFYGKELFALYKQVKKIFDPQNILNPGDIVDIHSMTDNLRYGADYSSIHLKTYLDFSEEQGFDRAIEMCNGAAVCRKRTIGTMCPSFMVTREEEHSTRGRANMLRAVLSGRLPVPELTSERMYRVMDLCVECKGCKAECPSSVDMAKIKFEFLAQYHCEHGVPLRSRLFAHIARFSRFASGAWAPFINWKLSNPVFAMILDALLGISKHRKLPPFAREPFTRWFQNHRRPPGIDPGKKQVVLFNDTFNTYNDPHIAIAALEVLESMGYEVLLPGHRCCGRPMISRGLVEAAREAARDTVSRLIPFVKAGIPVVGLEPSCILSMRDEYLYLLPENSDARAVAENTFMWEEFLNRHFETADTPGNNGKSGKILFHGHCHQKALVGTDPSLEMFCRLGYQVEVVDSGCCGMAGSFGYEKEHYQISIAMAERRLVPAIQQADPNTLIVAPGTSCRHQIAHTTGKTALHPVEVVHRVLKDAAVAQNFVNRNS